MSSSDRFSSAPAPTPKLGILQLKTTFPRPPGDVGHPASWGSIPVVIRVVEEADPATVVGGTWGVELVEAFVREGERMRREEGVVAFVTSCGFLATMHPYLVDRLPWIGTSSLIQVAWLQNSFFTGKQAAGSVGVVTFKKSSLTRKHLESVGAHPDTPVYGLPEGKEGVFRAVLAEEIPYDHAGMEREVVGAAQALLADHPEVKAIVLECTNMPPFSGAVQRATGRRVYDILTLGKWLYEGAVPPSHQQ